MSETQKRPESGGLEARFRASADPIRAETEKRYLKSDLEFIGASLPAIRAAARELPRGREAVVHLAEELWSRPVFELRMVAVVLLGHAARSLEPTDFQLLERMLRESKTWAFVDNLSTDVVATVVERYPELGKTIDSWSQDEHFWLRRAAMLSLLPPLRRGAGDWKRFSGYADRMLDEREFFIRKAIGWVLREVSKKRPQLVYEWLEPRASRASGVTIREAVKYLSPGQRQAILELK